MNQIINRHVVSDALNAAEVDFGQIEDTYSGRYMFGGACLAVQLVGKSQMRNLCRFFVTLTEQTGDVELATQLADALCLDDLGRDMIVYFPGWALALNDES